MNGWGIAALVFAAGCLGVAVWALLERSRYKGLLAASKWGQELAKDHGMQALKKVEAERDANKLQAETSLAQLDSVATSLTTCLTERNALTLQLKEATEAKTRAARARTNRAKSPAQE